MPVLPPGETRRVADAVEEAAWAADGLDRARREAEHLDAADGLSFDQVDLWLPVIRTQLEQAQLALAEWRATTADVDEHL